MMRAASGVTAAAVAMVWGGASVQPAAAEMPMVPVVVAKAVNGCFASIVRFTGLVVPRAEAVVNLNIDGYEISEVDVAEGDTVTAGQVLAKLTRLSGGPSGGQEQRPQQQQAAQQQQMPATMALTAPTGGLVSKVGAKVGAVASAVPLPPPMGPEPLFRIIVDKKLEIEANVPSVQLPKLKAGQLARVSLDTGREMSSEVRAVLPEVDRQTQLGKVRLSVLDGDPAIRAGTFARGTIDASHSCGVSIPRTAVQYQTAGTTVQVAHDGTVETRRVVLGFFSETDTEVREGVKEGELVIANAGSSLHDGDRVKPINMDEIDRVGAR
jgi:HlyD family secretion protein